MGRRKSESRSMTCNWAWRCKERKSDTDNVASGTPPPILVTQRTSRGRPSAQCHPLQRGENADACGIRRELLKRGTKHAPAQHGQHIT